jgi:hypothetical protein
VTGVIHQCSLYYAFNRWAHSSCTGGERWTLFIKTMTVFVE